MKVQQLPLGFWEQEGLSSPSSSTSTSSSSSLTINFKRLRPLAPRLTNTETITSLDSQSFNSPKAKCNAQNADTSPSGGTRWNPTQEQIGTLEALYKGGMRTPNAHQIERITAELGKYGRIEGKNVFYWFQNHKARERQKQKRNALALTEPSPPRMTLFPDSNGEAAAREELYDGSSCKRKCRSWGAGSEMEEGGGDGTLELFPLHPEGGR